MLAAVLIFAIRLAGLSPGDTALLIIVYAFDYFVGNMGVAVVTINQREISRFPCGRPNGRPERETR
ncbi:hypothetical protein P7H15_15570 [Paenibacillus larvae]|nr:hypothetical protein [Paenibacillus larvae]MDT2293946.1 hypothetical protein [Paenibacillus larvae]